MKHIRTISTIPAPALSLDGIAEFVDIFRMFIALLEELNMVLGIPIPMKGR